MHWLQVIVLGWHWRPVQVGEGRAALLPAARRTGLRSRGGKLALLRRPDVANCRACGWWTTMASSPLLERRSAAGRTCEGAVAACPGSPIDARMIAAALKVPLPDHIGRDLMSLF